MQKQKKNWVDICRQNNKVILKKGRTKKMKQKIDKINWYILAFVFAIELIMLNIVLKQCGISLYNNSYNWIRNILIIFSLDIVYILFLIDKTTKARQTDNILDIYKIDAN